MSTLLSELFYMLWPSLTWLALAPLFVVFFLFELVGNFTSSFGFSSESSPLFSEWLWKLSFAGLMATGVVALEELGYRLWLRFKQSLKRSVTSGVHGKHWVLLWGIHWGVLIIAVHLFWPRFSESQDPSMWIIMSYFMLLIFGVASLFRYLCIFVGKQMQRFMNRYTPSSQRMQWSGRIGLILLSLITIYPFLAALGVIIWFQADSNPSASQFFVLHAAIKNTCLIDPDRENCPHTLEELSYIEPEAFAAAQECCQLQYEYWPETNDYSFVVRYHPRRAVIFDQRLVAEDGIDFRESMVKLWGQDSLVDTSTWDGPWEFPDWQY